MSMLHIRMFWLVPLLLLRMTGAVHAQVPLISTGPSVSFGRLGFQRDTTNPAVNKATFDVLAAGAGWTLRVNPSKLVSSDGRVAYMSWDATALAQLTTLPIAGGLSIATGPSFYNGLIGLEVGVKLFEFSQAHGPEGLLAWAGGRRNVFFLISLSTNLLLGSNAPTDSAGTRASAEHPLPNYIRF
jgi:hypothetical protein